MKLPLIWDAMVLIEMRCESRMTKITHGHYDDVIMSEIASQITSLTIVYSIVHSGTDQSKHQSSASLAFVWEIHRWPVNFPHKWPVTRKMFPFDDVIMDPEHCGRVCDTNEHLIIFNLLSRTCTCDRFAYSNRLIFKMDVNEPQM